MKTLSQQRFNKTKSFVMNQGRPLDQRLFEYHFECGNKAHVLAELALYQNGDGGFGHGLEPDLRTPVSSVIATSQGFSILREVKASGRDPLVQRAISYLLNTYDPKQQVWPIIPPASNNAPHAPWWNYQDVERNFDKFLVNPRAAVVGHLHHYADLVPAEFLAQARALVVTHLEACSDEMEMHDLLCYLELARADNLPEPERERICGKVKQLIPKSVIVDPDKWSSYNLRPLDVVSSPGSQFADAFNQTELEANLDFEIGQQQADGAWALTWSWKQVDPDAWRQAERDWRGHLALRKLQTLRAFGRIEHLLPQTTT